MGLSIKAFASAREIPPRHYFQTLVHRINSPYTTATEILTTPTTKKHGEKHIKPRASNA